MSKPIVFTLSTEELNSYNIRIMSAGIRLEVFNTNPIMLYMHERGNVIGRWENLRVEDGKLLADAVFDMEDECAAKIAGKVERKFLRAVSIGIYIVAYHFAKEAENEVMIIDECDLYEASIVDVPSNKSALRLYDANHNEIDLSKGLMQFKSNLSESPKPSKINMDLKAMAKVFGLPEDATEEQITLAAQTAQQAATNLANLQNQQKEAQKRRAVSLVDAAISEKRLNATLKDKMLKLADADFELFEETLKSLPAPLSLTDIAQGKIATPVSLTDEKKKWTFEDWRKNDPDALISLEKSDWATFAALFKAEYGVEPEKD